MKERRKLATRGEPPLTCVGLTGKGVEEGRQYKKHLFRGISKLKIRRKKRLNKEEKRQTAEGGERNERTKNSFLRRGGLRLCFEGLSWGTISKGEGGFGGGSHLGIKKGKFTKDQWKRRL